MRRVAEDNRMIAENKRRAQMESKVRENDYYSEQIWKSKA